MPPYILTSALEGWVGFKGEKTLFSLPGIEPIPQPSVCSMSLQSNPNLKSGSGFKLRHSL